MALDIPTTAKEISQKAKIDVRREIVSSDPFLARSYLGAIISGISNRIFEFYQSLRDSELEANPATADRNLLRWANGYGLTQLPGAAASGQVFVNASSGGIGNVIPNATRFSSSSGAIYVSVGSATLAASAPTVTLTRVGTTITALFSGAHGLASNAVVTIAGATPTEYNATLTPITVTGTLTFEYEVPTAPASSPATGTITAAIAGATVIVNSEEAGVDFNLSGDAELTFETPIAGVESPVLVTFSGIIDGTDLETEAELQARLLDLLQNPVANFNAAQIRKVLLAISGVTRVFVQEETPAVGQVTVYFMRDGDDSPIPDTAEIAAGLAAVIAIKPAHTADADVIVSAPTEVSTAFTFTAGLLVPNTDSMKAAVAAQLAEFFSKQPDVGVDVVEDAYRSAIFNTIDPVTGARVTSFTLSAPPAAPITIVAGEIATLGAVTFL